MTSKKSFLVDIKTNARRRVWLIVVMFLGFFFSMPVFTAMLLSMEKMYLVNYRQTGLYLGKVFARYIGLRGGMSVFIVVLAVIAALQGFSYMYQRKKLDLYMSVPVTKGRRFAAIYLNGFLAFFLAYLLNMLLSFFVAQAMGADVSLAVEEAAAAFLGNTVLYLAAYHIAILAVMLTGNLIVTVMGTAVLFFYDGVLWALLMSYMETFFCSFYHRTAEQFGRYIISPVIRFFRFMGEIYDGYIYDTGRILYWDRFFMGLWPVALAAVVAIIAAYWCYTKKPAEVCGKAMAFPLTKPVIKVLITIQAGLGGGIIFYSLSGRSRVFLVFGMLAGTLLCHGVIEVIYDFDIRSVKNGWKSLLAAGACVAVIFCLFRFDVFGYDSYVPDPDAVEDIAVRFTDYYDSYYDEDLNSIGADEYVFENMHITNVFPVLELAAGNMVDWESRMENEDTETCYRYTVIRYHLKNGKDVYREFPVPYRECAALLDEIISDEAYQKGFNAIYNEPVMELGSRAHLYYNNGDGDKAVSEFTLEELKDAYRKDLEHFNFTTMMEELVMGDITLECIEDGVYVHGSYPVYPSFTNTIALLERDDCYRGGYLNLDEVEQIIVRNSNSKIFDEYAQQDVYDPEISFSYSSFTVEKGFDDPKEMEEIAKALYPDRFTSYWLPDKKVDNDYYVTVIYKSGMGRGESYSSSFYMLADEIPDFVKERTVYQQDGDPVRVPVDTAVPAGEFYNF